jgi:hypothetical protein
MKKYVFMSLLAAFQMAETWSQVAELGAQKYMKEAFLERFNNYVYFFIRSLPSMPSFRSFTRAGIKWQDT